MSTILLMTEQERIEQIDAQNSLNKLSEFEISVLSTMRKQRFGSAKQLKILAGIEQKLFGRDFDMEPTKRKCA